MAKSISLIMARQHPHWVGNGFHVLPVFGEQAFTKALSPFLMFDYASPKTFAATKEKRGVGMHPHRGFETVTIAFQGEVEHKDSKGNTGVIGSGDVQWMTAGAGIFHEEFHSSKFAKTGGPFEMVQLWVNLPSYLKMTTPKYQAIEAKDIPEVPLPGEAGKVRVIGGEYEGVKGAAATQAFDQPRGMVQLWEVVLNGGPVELKIPPKQTTILFTRRGTVTLGDQTLPEQRAALLSEEGNVVRLSSPGYCSLLVMGGDPIRDETGEVEPIAAQGPMVMNTKQEIRDAMEWARQEAYKYY
jgi:hypothetical protein